MSNGVQSNLSFSKEFRHCNVIAYEGDNWVLFELDNYGINHRVVKVTTDESLYRALKTMDNITCIITAYVSERNRMPWKPWYVRSCNEFCRYVSAINIGFTFNPRHLYSKLLKHNKLTNYEIVQFWRKKWV